MSISILIFDDGCCLDLPARSTSHLRLKLQKFPWPRWDFHMSRALCFQGGGVNVYGGSVTFSSCTITGNTATVVRAHAQNSHRPDGMFTCLRVCSQGGGVSVWGGTVTFSSCTITGNTATVLRAHAQNFPSPPTPANFPSPRWDSHMFCACACRAAVSLWTPWGVAR